MSTEVTTIVSSFPLPPSSLPEKPPPTVTVTTTTTTTTSPTTSPTTAVTTDTTDTTTTTIPTLTTAINPAVSTNIKRRKRKGPKSDLFESDISITNNNNNNNNNTNTTSTATATNSNDSINNNNNNNNNNTSLEQQQEQQQQERSQNLGNVHSLKKRKLNNSSAMVTFGSDTYANHDSNFSIEWQSHFSDKTILPEGKEGQGAAVLVNRDHDNSDDNDVRVKAPQVNADGTEIYQGLKSYRDPTRDPTARKAPKFLGIGPQRAPDNVKITCRFDYQPDICKDWKETGYCGYGLSCKFVHDRSDYKAGWQIENDWNQYQKQQKLKLKVKGGSILTTEEQEEWDKFGLGQNKGADDNPYEIHESDNDDDVEKDTADGLPFACYICREAFKDPVVTKCGHYFCEQCAFKQYRKTPACAICGEKTEGQFATAEKLIRKLKTTGKM